MFALGYLVTTDDIQNGNRKFELNHIMKIKDGIFQWFSRGSRDVYEVKLRISFLNCIFFTKCLLN